LTLSLCPLLSAGIVKLVKAMPMPDTTPPAGSTRAIGTGGLTGATSQDQLEETPGLWVLEKNWRHRLENASAAADALDAANGLGEWCVL
jgi:hypothetical protein